MKKIYKIFSIILILNLILLVNVFAIDKLNLNENEMKEMPEIIDSKNESLENVISENRNSIINSENIEKTNCVIEDVEVSNSEYIAEEDCNIEDDLNLNIEKEETIDTLEESEELKLEKITHVNPLYSNILNDDEVPEESVENSDSKLLYAPAICSTIQQAGNIIRPSLKNRTRSITICYKTPTRLDSSIYEQILDEAMKHTGVPTEGDYISWQYGKWTGSGEGRIEGNTYYYNITITVLYYTTYQQEVEMNRVVSNLLKTLNLKGSEYEKITTIYNYICSNVKYDYDQSSDVFKHTAYAALINKKAVCQGYALLFYRLALESKIDARLIAGIGNGGPHGWNIVKIGNQYYNLDSTWDAGYANGKYRYYLLSENNFTNHTRDSEYSTSDFYKKYPMATENYTTLIQVNGVWRMVESGNVLYNYNGIGTNSNGTWYIKNGTIDFTYTGTCIDNGKTYVVQNNKVMTNYNKVMIVDNVWRKVENGVVNYSYTGIGNNENGSWYLENGEVTFRDTLTSFEDNKAYIVENSKVVAVVNKNTTEVIVINNKWRKVENGEVKYNYEGIGINSNGTWYLKNGTIDFTYTGTCIDNGKTYVVQNNKVMTNYNKVMIVDNVWRKVENGVVNYSYTGIGNNENGSWYVKDGEVTFRDTLTSFEDNKAYIVENSKVVAVVTKDTTEVMVINNKWRKVENGEVKYNYEGIGINSNGTWYLKNGTIDFTYTGTCIDNGKTYVVQNNKVMTNYNKVMIVDNVWRKVENGVVNYSYTGIGNNENGSWYLENGEVTFNYTGPYTDSSGKVYKIVNSKVIN